MDSPRPLRLWPGVAIAIVQVAIMFGAPIVVPDAPLPIGMMGGLAGALLIFIWWLLFSRAAWLERVGALALAIAAIFAARSLAHISIVGAGQGNLIYILPLPYISLALVVWAVATRSLQDGARRAALAVVIALTVAPFALIRTAGVSGSAGSEFHWRWTPTPEERLLAQANDEPKPIAAPAAPVTAPSTPVAVRPADAPATVVAGKPVPADRDKPAAAPTATPAERASTDTKGSPREAAAMSERKLPPERELPRVEWPGFRGPHRDSIVRGVQIRTDWSTSPPVEMWRRPIGPGWSSFAVQGDLLYTQEQRGDDEVVSCYKVSTGEPVWRHRNAVRFYESNGGAGPRGTPALSNGRVFTMGATGILNALDAATGAVLWSHDMAAEAKVKIPMWGISSSPLIVDDLVIASASGAVGGYDFITGQQRWLFPSRGGSYSSPHLTTIDGVRQIVFLAGPGALGLAPDTGALLWEHTWDGGAIVQPAVTADGDLLINAISMTGGVGTRRLAVAHRGEGWHVEERWTSNGLKPYFNDFVVHKGHAFGFDGSILASIDLQDGKRKWKGGRYGNGQLLLLADQDLLLVLSEEGELALVGATTDQFKELARFPALDAKTWNHPVLVGDILLVRNGEEMAAFRLSLAPATH